MSKRVLVTAGAVYGRLDDNKLVTNRTRGIWATKFADWLFQRHYDVTLIVPDLMHYVSPYDTPHFTVIEHKGFDDYQRICVEQAPTHDAAIMAAAVLNWLPDKPFPGKMPTDGVPGEATIEIKFRLMPRVIDQMRAANRNLNLIGCKLTARASQDELRKAAYKTLLGAKANVVVANDLSSLRLKAMVYPDGATFLYDSKFDEFFQGLRAVIDDEHYQTVTAPEHLARPTVAAIDSARQTFTQIVDANRARFVTRLDGHDRVFGGIAVRIDDQWSLVSPREKAEMFGADNAVIVALESFDRQQVCTVGGIKASLNAPLLGRHLKLFSRAVLHLHEQLPNVPTEPYAPPGTVRDNWRAIPGPSYNIEGHGFISVVD